MDKVSNCEETKSCLDLIFVKDQPYEALEFENVCGFDATVEIFDVDNNRPAIDPVIVPYPGISRFEVPPNVCYNIKIATNSYVNHISWLHSVENSFRSVIIDYEESKMYLKNIIDPNKVRLPIASERDCLGGIGDDLLVSTVGLKRGMDKLKNGNLCFSIYEYEDTDLSNLKLEVFSVTCNAMVYELPIKKILDNGGSLTIYAEANQRYVVKLDASSVGGNSNIVSAPFVVTAMWSTWFEVYPLRGDIVVTESLKNPFASDISDIKRGLRAKITYTFTGANKSGIVVKHRHTETHRETVTTTDSNGVAVLTLTDLGIYDRWYSVETSPEMRNPINVEWFEPMSFTI